MLSHDTWAIIRDEEGMEQRGKVEFGWFGSLYGMHKWGQISGSQEADVGIINKYE